MPSIFKKRIAQDLLIYGSLILIIVAVVYIMLQPAVQAPGEGGDSQSFTDGPVHWHANIAYEACGDPLTFNDDGSHEIIHGHNDELVHVEGVVINESDITLAEFFKSAALNITSTNLDIYKNGDLCEGTSASGKVGFDVDGQTYTDPNQIIIKDKQNILVIFE